jgi:hypothetical protein
MKELIRKILKEEVMKIIITESQYDKLISSLTGEPKRNPSLFSKFKNWISGNSDNEVGEMLLKSIETENYEFVGIDTSYSTYTINFTINDFPFKLIKDNSNKNNKFSLYMPYFKEELKINKNLLMYIFKLMAKRHMNIKDYFDMYLTDMENSL